MDSTKYYLSKLKSLNIPIKPEYCSYSTSQFEEIIKKYNNNNTNNNNNSNNTIKSIPSQSNNQIQSNNTNTNESHSNIINDSQSDDDIPNPISNRNTHKSLNRRLIHSQNPQTVSQRAENTALSSRKKIRSQNFTISFKNKILKELPDEFNAFFKNFDVNNLAFAFLYDIILSKPLKTIVTYNRRHYLFIKTSKYDPDTDSPRITTLINKSHFIKHYTCGYEYTYKDKHFFITYFYFYYNDSIRIDIDPNDTWRIIHSNNITIIPNILAGNYGNKNLVYLNFSYDKNTDTSKTRSKDFNLYLEIRKLNILSFIDYKALYKQKKFYLQEGYENYFEDDD